MELYHSTNQKITKINTDGRFGGFLFFGSDDMGHGEHVYKLETAEISWDIQTLTAKAAKILGYRGVAVRDEHGTSWMIDMLNKEKELILC